MSAAKKNAKRDPHDFFPTPAETTRPLLHWLNAQQIGIDTALDPAAGEGALLRELSCDRYAYEIREECRMALEDITVTTIICDALVGTPSERAVDLVVCNPPYSLAREFVSTFRYVGRTSAFLLRLGFLASQRRAPRWSENPPAHVLVLSSRPSFTGDGKTDNSDYCWAVWKGRTPKGYTRLDWLVAT